MPDKVVAKSCQVYLFTDGTTSSGVHTFDDAGKMVNRWDHELPPELLAAVVAEMKLGPPQERAPEKEGQ